MKPFSIETMIGHPVFVELVGGPYYVGILETYDFDTTAVRLLDVRRILGLPDDVYGFVSFGDLGKVGELKASAPIHEMLAFNPNTIMLMSKDAWANLRLVPWSGMGFASSEAMMAQYEEAEEIGDRLREIAHRNAKNKPI